MFDITGINGAEAVKDYMIDQIFNSTNWCVSFDKEFMEMLIESFQMYCYFRIYNEPDGSKKMYITYALIANESL